MMIVPQPPLIQITLRRLACVIAVCMNSTLLPSAGGQPVMQVMVWADQLSDEQIDSTGHAVMQHNDFRSVRRRLQDPLPASDPDKGFLNALGEQVGNFFSNIFSSVSDFFEWLFSGRSQPANKPAQPPGTASNNPASLDGIGRLLMVLLIVAVLAILTVIASLAIKSRDKRRSASAVLPDADSDDLSNLSVAPGETLASTYESRALQFAAQGNFRAAIRELLLGAMSWIERSGLIRFRRGLTNRDYLRAVWRRTDQRNAFGVVGLAFEQIVFGRRDATEDMFLSSLHAFQEAFREEETANTTV